MNPVIQLDKKFTYRDYLSWDDSNRWEIIDGIAYDMSPSPSRKHQDISRILFLQIGNYLMDKTCIPYHPPFDVRLPESNEDDEDIFTVVQPDIVVVCDKSKLDDKGCKGAPDLIIEIISPTTAAKDLKVKFFLYEKHGVKEYWIIYPETKTVSIYKLGSDGKYDRPMACTSDDIVIVELLGELKIDLSKVFLE